MALFGNRLNSEPQQRRAVLRKIKCPLFDTVVVPAGQRVADLKFFMDFPNDPLSGEFKTLWYTNMHLPQRIPVPEEFDWYRLGIEIGATSWDDASGAANGVAEFGFMGRPWLQTPVSATGLVSVTLPPDCDMHEYVVSRMVLDRLDGNEQPDHKTMPSLPAHVKIDKAEAPISINVQVENKPIAIGPNENFYGRYYFRPGGFCPTGLFYMRFIMYGIRYVPI